MNWTDLLTGFGGAFFGALAAYCFEKRKDSLKSTEDQHSAFLVAQMTLVYQINSLGNLKRSLLDPYRETPGREFKMPFFHQVATPYSVDFRSLSFLLTSGEPNILMDIYLADRGFANAIDSVGIRNVELERFQSSSRVLDFNQETGAARVEASSPQAKILRDVTDAMFQTIDRAIKTHSDVFVRLRSVGKTQFPKRKLLNYEDSPLSSTQN